MVRIGVFGHLRLMASSGSSSFIDLSSKYKIAVGELMFNGRSVNAMDAGKAIISQFGKSSPIGKSAAIPIKVQGFLIEHHFASRSPSPLEPKIKNISNP